MICEFIIILCNYDKIIGLRYKLHVVSVVRRFKLKQYFYWNLSKLLVFDIVWHARFLKKTSDYVSAPHCSLNASWLKMFNRYLES